MAAVQQQAAGVGPARPHTPANQLIEASVRSPPGSGVESYFNTPAALGGRSTSIYSLSRASFTAQLAQLTTLSLPDSATLASSVAAIPTAPAAATALRNAAAPIQQWIQKAVEVLGGLDAADDVEWAAAGGRDGLEEVDSAIAKFQRLVNVYVEAIENLQKREDISAVPKADLGGALDTLDDVVASWANVSRLLKEVKRQVELALEWEQLWNTVLGEIRLEIENLSKLIFEMEEKRHHAKAAAGSASAGSPTAAPADISELETIVEEGGAPARGSAGKHRRQFSLPMQSPLQSSAEAEEVAELVHSSLMELFARMQPLRASLDFLPMRLSGYRQRADSVLPTACDELDDQRKYLEKKYEALQKDAEKVQEELGEDKWVAAFRTAGKQAQGMCESVERAIVRVQEAFEGTGAGAQAAITKKITDYKDKKIAYGPAIQKVINIIDKGIKDRLTVNGEVLQILADTTASWRRLEDQIRQVDTALEDYQSMKSQQHLRDSMSSIMSHDFSATESAVDTPGSSPASSVIVAPQQHQLQPGSNKKPSLPTTPTDASRRSSMRSSSGSRPPLGQARATRTPAATATAATAPTGSALSKRLSYVPSISRLKSQSPSPTTRSSLSIRTGSSTPTPASTVASRAREASANLPTPRHTGKPVPIAQRPKWNSGTRVDYKKFETSYHPLALANGNPHTRSLNGSTLHSSRPASGLGQRIDRTASATLPSPSPLWRESSAEPAAAGTRSAYRQSSTTRMRAPSDTRPASAMHSSRPGSSLARGIRGATASPTPGSRPAPAKRTAVGSTAAGGAKAGTKPAAPTMANMKAHERHYTPSTPRGPPPQVRVASSSSSRHSLLPVASVYTDGSSVALTSPTSSTFDDSPSARAAERPATSLGMSGRRSSLLPAPAFKY